MTNLPLNAAPVQIEVPEDTEAVNARQELLQKRLSARVAQAERSHAYALTQYGTESPEAKQASGILAARRLLASQLKATLQRRTLTTPEANPESFTVYGRVSDAAGLGMAGVVVRATDEAQRHLGEDKTDAQGGFVIRTSGKPSACCDERQQPPKDDPTRPYSGPQTGGLISHLDGGEDVVRLGGNGGSSRVLYLSAEKDGKILYRDGTSTAIALGKVMARELKVS